MGTIFPSVNRRNAHPALAGETQKECIMERYEAIEQHIRQARLERSVYVAELVADAILTTWKGIKYAADVVLSVARAKTHKNVFTFDA